jgi:hypothetical protein
MGTRLGAVAFAATYTGGDLTGGCGGPRQAKVVLVCDSSATAASPTISVAEVALCSCKTHTTLVLFHFHFLLDVASVMYR